MLRGEPREGNGEIETERYISVAVVAEAVNLPLHLGVLVQFPEQNLTVLKGRGLNRSETEVAKHPLGQLDRAFLHNGALGQFISKAL